MATVVADVVVDSTVPGTALGTATEIGVDAGPAIRRTFFRIAVGNLGTRTISRAVLALRVGSGTNAKSVSGGQIHPITNCTWAEATTTWANQPLIDGPVLATLGAVDLTQTVSLDITAGIPGDGTFCFALDSLSTDGADYSSREASTGKPTVTITLAP